MISCGRPGPVGCRPLGPGDQRPRQRRQPRRRHPVVVGDENPHVRSPYRPPPGGGRGCHATFGPRLPGLHRRRDLPLTPARALVCFNSLAMPARTPRISVASPTGQQWRIGHGRQEVIVCEVGATLRAYSVGDTRSSTASAPTSGPTRAVARCSPHGPTGWPTVATSSTGCGPRPPSTSPSAATPSTASCGGCPGRSRRGTRTSSPCGSSSTPRPATRSPCCSSSSTTSDGTG